MSTTKRKVMGPLPGIEWHTGIAYAYGVIDEKVAAELVAAGIPRNPSGEYSGMAEYAALARVAERHTAEYVAFARRNHRINPHNQAGSWEWVAERLGCTPAEAQKRYGKLPEPPLGVFRADHGPECGDSPVEHLRRDLKGWGCKCGAVGRLDW